MRRQNQTYNPDCDPYQDDSQAELGRIDRPPTTEPAESEGKLKPCPLCHEAKDMQIEQLPGYKPEIVCNNCGIALQGEDVLDAITRWNKRTAPPAESVEDAKAFKRVAIELRIRFPVEIQYNSEFEAMVKRLEGGSL